MCLPPAPANLAGGSPAETICPRARPEGYSAGTNRVDGSRTHRSGPLRASDPSWLSGRQRGTSCWCHERTAGITRCGIRTCSRSLTSTHVRFRLRHAVGANASRSMRPRCRCLRPATRVSTGFARTSRTRSALPHPAATSPNRPAEQAPCLCASLPDKYSGPAKGNSRQWPARYPADSKREASGFDQSLVASTDVALRPPNCPPRRYRRDGKPN